MDKLSVKISADWAYPTKPLGMSTFLQEGVKYNKFGDFSRGEDIILERNKVFNNAQAYATNFGDRIFYTQYLDEKGDVIYAPSRDDSGNIILPDDKGRFRKINQEWLDRIRDTFVAKQKLVDANMEYLISAEDDDAAVLLGFTPTQWKTEIACANKGMTGMSDEMIKLDCQLTTIRSYPSSSVLQTQSLSKLRWICDKRPFTVQRTAVSKEKESDDNTVKAKVETPSGNPATSGSKSGSPPVEQTPTVNNPTPPPANAVQQKV